MKGSIFFEVERRERARSHTPWSGFTKENKFD